MSKSEGLFLGAWRSKQDTPVSLTWHNDKTCLLGIVVGKGPNIAEINLAIGCRQNGSSFQQVERTPFVLVRWSSSRPVSGRFKVVVRCANR